MNIVHVLIFNMKQWTPEEIKDFRHRHSLYQKQLADLLGVTERYIIYLEKGVKKPSRTITLFLNCLEKQMKLGKEKGKEV